MPNESSGRADWAARAGVLLALSLGGFALIWPFSRQGATQPGSGTTISANAENATANQLRELQLQKLCAEQAKESFERDRKPRKAGMLESYTNHYNAKLQKCFILTNTWDGSASKTGMTFVSQDLSDAFENLSFGDFDKSVVVGPPETERILECEMMPAEKPDEAKCKSEAEWKAYVRRYMESDQ